MKRLLLTGLLGCAAATAFPAPASAQIFVGGGVRVPGVPTYGNMNFQYQRTGFVSVGGISFGYNFAGPVGYGIYNNRFRNNYSQPGFLAPSSSGYLAGGVRANNAAARDFGMAQQQAAAMRNAPAARTAIYDQWAYEKLGVVGVPGIKPGEDAPAALLKALNGASEAEIASGEALNHIVVGIVAAEKKGKAASAFLPPNLLAQLRFAGSNAADAVNLLRQVGNLQLPAAFDADAFAKLKPELEKDLAAAAAPVLLGKPADFNKVAKLEADAAKARAALDPITRTLEFEDATAARRFLNQLDAAVAALKAPNTSGLIEPKWNTEGTSVADLVKYVVKNKLLFGPAPKGEEDAYAALHRGLATYLVGLNESAKPAPKK
ncbi:MAG: hypothetical protein U0791_13140 [Gemmataceae bacterium]